MKKLKVFNYLDKIANKNKKIDSSIDIHSHENWELYNSAKAGLDYVKRCEMLGGGPNSRGMFEITEGTYRGIPVTLYSPSKKNPGYVEKKKLPDGPGEFDVKYTIHGVESKSSALLKQEMKKLYPAIDKIFGLKAVMVEISESDCGTSKIELRDGHLCVEYDTKKKEIIIRGDEW